MSLFRIYILLIVCITQTSYGQSSSIKALSKFERAVLAYEVNDLSTARDLLVDTRQILQGSNLKIQYYLVKSFYRLQNYKRCRTELELYFDYYEMRKEQTYFYNDSVPKRYVSKRDEMIKILDFVDEKIINQPKAANYDLEMQESLNWIKSKIDEFGIHSNKYIYTSYNELNKEMGSSSGGFEKKVAHGKLIRECLMTFDNNFNVTIKYELKNRRLPITYKFNAKDIEGAQMKLDTAEVELKYETADRIVIDKKEDAHYYLQINGFSDQTNKFCMDWDYLYDKCNFPTHFLDLMLTNDEDLTQRMINAFNYIGELNRTRRLKNKPAEKF